jgi:hypothetical protein
LTRIDRNLPRAQADARRDEMKAKILLLIGLLALAGCSASADANKHGAGASVGVGDEQATGSVRR